MKWHTQTEQVVEREVVMVATYDGSIPTSTPVEVRVFRRRDYLTLMFRYESSSGTITLTPEAADELGRHLISLAGVYELQGTPVPGGPRDLSR